MLFPVVFILQWLANHIYPGVPVNSDAGPVLWLLCSEPYHPVYSMYCKPLHFIQPCINYPMYYLASLQSHLYQQYSIYTIYTNTVYTTKPD